jgi:hypothetical protein
MNKAPKWEWVEEKEERKRLINKRGVVGGERKNSGEVGEKKEKKMNKVRV